MKKSINTVYLILFCLTANSYRIIERNAYFLFLIIPLFIFINLFAGTMHPPIKNRRVRVCSHGALLLSVFEISVLISIIYHIVILFSADLSTVLWSILFCAVAHLILFWNGIICIYITASQLGLKYRILGIVCGMIPIINIIVLRKLIKIAREEAEFEFAREERNSLRYEEKLCDTRYPILLVHGVFFRDFKYFNYWGRIPEELELCGADIYYGNHQSAASVADSARELTSRIKEITAETGCEKVNIIAHSKGGLDCRYAVSILDAAPMVASLTTINTPHRGCLFADYLLDVIPEKTKNKVAAAYNSALKKLGDPNPDFLAAVGNLTASFCTELDAKLGVPENIFCQSVGSVQNKARGGKFPLNFTYHLVKYFDGANDGLVSVDSFEWGENHQLLKPTGKRGISHGDMIDLNRENIGGFDVREFYVGLVNDLKKRGL
ncbi:MAG: triacylglycerol lipase [Oscillospiraceae bacterium]|nr:triacylglycerol lipase [Oscillospiraceae bacterium]